MTTICGKKNEKNQAKIQQQTIPTIAWHRRESKPFYFMLRFDFFFSLHVYFIVFLSFLPFIVVFYFFFVSPRFHIWVLDGATRERDSVVVAVANALYAHGWCERHLFAVLNWIVAQWMWKTKKSKKKQRVLLHAFVFPTQTQILTFANKLRSISFCWLDSQPNVPLLSSLCGSVLQNQC